MSTALYARSGVYLLIAALVGGGLFAFGVLAMQQSVIAKLSGDVAEMSNQVGMMKIERDAAVTELESSKDTERHIAIAVRENKLYLFEGPDAIRVMPVATGSGRKFRIYGREYEFVTPPGIFTVTRKETDPVWIAPDWYWHEKGETVPENITVQERTFRGHLGKYRLYMRDGLGIHGTNEPWSIGRRVTHGCIRVGDKDLEILFNAVDSGARVYIY